MNERLRFLLDGLKAQGWDLHRRHSRGFVECPRCAEIMAFEAYHDPVGRDEEIRWFDVCDGCGWSEPVNPYIADLYENERAIQFLTLTADREAKAGCAFCQSALAEWRERPTHDSLTRLLVVVEEHGEEVIA